MGWINALILSTDTDRRNEMTRKELIEEIKNRIGFETDYECYKMSESEREFYTDILKELEQEPCEDCVSRNTLKRLVSELTYWHPTTDGRLEVGGGFDKTVYKVDDVWRLTHILPPVTPQQKTGYWIFDEVLDRHYYCSECKSMGVDYWDYCPNCGCYNGGDRDGK